MRLSLKSIMGAMLAAACLIAGGLAPAAAQDREQVIATVNGSAVTIGEIQDFFAGLPPEYRQQGIEAVFGQIVEELIQAKAILPQAVASGLEDDPDIIAQVDEFRDQLLVRTFIIRAAEKRVDQAVVRETYEGLVTSEEQVEVSHILLETEEAARDIAAKVAEGVPFADLAMEHSTGPSSSSGGYLGWISKGDTVPEFETAAFNLQANQFTADPVQSSFGWHVILVQDRRTIPPPSFEELEPQIRARLAQQQVGAVLQEVMGEADIERFGLDGQPLPAQ